MASLTDEQLPASNGINGQSHLASTSPEPTSILAKTVESVKQVGSSPVPETSSKNVEAFSANESTSLQTISPSQPTTDENRSDNKAGVKAEAVAEEVTSAERDKPPSDIDKLPTGEIGEVPQETTVAAHEGPTAPNVEEQSDGVKGAVEDDDVKMAERSPQGALSHSPEEAPKPETKLTPEQPTAEDPVSAKELSAEKSKSPVADTKPADVDMPDAKSETPAVTTSKVASPEKTSTHATPTLHTLSSSSLLPSLRDDRVRENSFTSAASDSNMADAPSIKVAREREDDEEKGPLAKRAKTEDTETRPEAVASSSQVQGSTTAAEDMEAEPPAVVMPPRVRAVAKAGSLADIDLDDSAISPYANREIRRVLASVKKTKAGNNFKDPVHKKWPMLWDSYTQRVAKPMDISLLERNLRENLYTTHAEFVNDMFLIHENSIAFNGVGTHITDEAKSLVDNFFTRLSDIPAQEAKRSEKKEPKQLPTRHTEPRAAATRRESRGAASSPIEDSVNAISASPIAVSTPVTAAVPAASLPSPNAAAAPAAALVEAATPVFAVPSSGVPIIRRDSAKNDGDRPKRPIHPPKNRDLGYEPKNPKKKQPEFRFCEEVLKELMKAKHYEINHWFLKPVDPVAMQIPTYHKVIKKPMDLGTMQTKLNLGEYGSAKEFENDFYLIVKNCRKFNVVGDVVDAANRLEDLFKLKWAEKDSWIASHTAPAAVVSPAAARDDESDEEVEESEEENDEVTVAPLTSDTVDALVKRLEEENNRLNKLLMAKIPDMTMITTQQTVLNMIQKQIVEEKTKLAAAESDRRSKKMGKAKSARSKKAAAGTGAAKKSAASGAGGGGLKKTAGASAKKAAKAKLFGQAEKTVVTDGINNLEGQQLEKAIDIIKKDTSQEESENGELELDIDQLSQDALGKLYDLIVKAFPHMKVKAEKTRTTATDASGQAVGKPSRPKKHKPMGKLEQERNIEKLREIKAQFQRPGSGSQEPLPSVEVNQPVEEDESEEESDVDSEEE
ncbi:transcription regulator [Niveomyces insectorum RCEF 264]|uniref:Transcription regulator n=1 Tax=Niveomyces insectorum RCEF 264 TaxID=1081102 RepID=A0A167P0Q4_9HYPO|nr:transcription regulator [Niveomyces insectorum RCEF 264]